ncbi:MAG: type II toxin-antitoxin system MqsA family antitoxin [Alphaproteobacteria bacterium]|nr:type II toxin-antitoxin system MqsA family antitoxin [Alphaproteobacteria bacterium]
MSVQKKTKTCPSCEGRMRRGIREQEVSFQRHVLKYSQPGWWCKSCDEGILEGEDNEVHDAALHEVMARAKKSPLSPLLIRIAREAVGVSQREAGRVFGGGPTAFYKYETARSIPSASMANLLRLALQRPDLFAKPAQNDFRLPTPKDIALLHKTAMTDRLDVLMRRVYPDVVA